MNEINIDAMTFPFPDTGIIKSIKPLTYDEIGNVLDRQELETVELEYKEKIFQLYVGQSFYDENDELIQKNYASATLVLSSLVDAIKRIDGK